MNELERLKNGVQHLIRQYEIWACDRCRICGGPMSIARSDHQGLKYVCEKTAEKIIPTDWDDPEYRSVQDHYRDSETWDRGRAGSYRGIANDLKNLVGEEE